MIKMIDDERQLLKRGLGWIGIDFRMRHGCRKTQHGHKLFDKDDL